MIAAFIRTHKHKPLWWWLATWFGSGLAPKASGTFGSLAALPFAFVIHYFFGNIALLGASVAAFIVGCWASEQFVRHGGKGEDPSDVVIDEVAGQWFLLAVLFPTWQSYLIGFLLFRIFDVIKPWPVCWADKKVKGGIGIMLDDMLAAFYPILTYAILLLQSEWLDSQDIMYHIINFLGGTYA
ncbi:MAG: phosphatidylglycerophosphatase A [Alphaproteobacteria bacterium]